LGKSGSRRRQSSIFFTHEAGATMFSRWISSSSFVGICYPISLAYLPIICIIRLIQEMQTKANSSAVEKPAGEGEQL
jgi:hypothetical protein